MTMRENQNLEERLQRLERMNAAWFYTWGGRPNVEFEQIPEGVEFIPMAWSRWGLQGEDPPIIEEWFLNRRARRYDTLLGFNEPDRANQANLTVEQALDLWPKLERTRLRLGSPATVHPDNEWMQAFMAGVEERGLRVDFICVHWYGGPNVQGFLNHLDRIHEMYGRPIWITEFAVGDWQAETVEDNRHSPERVYQFMRELLPELERREYIERFSWFSASPNSRALGTSALFDENGNLTRLGRLYASF